MNTIDTILSNINLNEMAVEKAEREGVVKKMKEKMKEDDYAGAMKIFKEAGGKNFTKDYKEVFSAEELSKLKSIKEKTPAKKKAEGTFDKLDAMFDKAEKKLEAYSTLLSKRKAQKGHIEDQTSKGAAILKKDPNAMKQIESDIDKYESAIKQLKSFLSIDKEKYREENFADLSKEEKKKIMDNLAAARKLTEKEIQEDLKKGKKGAHLGPKEKGKVAAPYEDKQALAIAKKYADSGSAEAPNEKQFNALKRLVDLMYRPKFKAGSERRSKEDAGGSAFPLETKKEIQAYSKAHEELKKYKDKLNNIKTPSDLDPGDYQDIYDTIEGLYNALSEGIKEPKNNFTAINEMLLRLKKLG